MPGLRVVVADDHPSVLAALVTVLQDTDDLIVAAAVGNGLAAVSAVATHEADVVLLDVQMPGGGVETAAALAQLPSPPVVIAVSAHAGSRVVEEMLRAGATGFVTKGRIGDDLVDIVRRCARGEVVLAATSATSAVRALTRSRS